MNAPTRRSLICLTVCAVCTIGCANEQDPVAGRSPELNVQLRWTLSGYDGGWGTITSVVADENGRIFVVDGQTHEILVFDSAGRRIGTIGGVGEGPGEFRRLSSLSWTGELLTAFDVRSRRFTFFDRDGKVVATHTLDQPHQASASSLMSGGDTAYGVFRRPLDATSVYLVVEHPESIVSVPPIPEPPRPPTGMLCDTKDGSISPAVSAPLADYHGLRAFLPGGQVAIAHRDKYLIEVYRVQDGGLVRTVEREYPHLPLTDEDWEIQPETQQFRQLERQYGRLKHMTESRECPFEDFRPASWPVIRGVISDHSGRLWVESTARDRRGLLLTLIDQDGAVVGESPMPERDRGVLPYARGDRLYMVTIDELDVQSIQVYQVRADG